MDSLKQNHYKECTPEITVKNISNKLASLGMTIEQKSLFKSSIDTNSVRLVIKDTDIGSNGKGVNSLYSNASAFAEFIERLQNLHMDSFTSLIPDKKDGFYLFPDERILFIDELINQNDPFLDYYFKQTKINKEDFLKIHVMDSQKTKIDNSFICIPFWDYLDERKVYLPYTVYRPCYGSNGMCAGNTPEEALVQGLSEVIERIVMKRIIDEKITLPCIPEDYIKQFPDIYNRYQKIKENKLYFVKLLDCSLGGKYPVAGLLIVERNTGNYGLKLGAHPDIEIAIERTMTEASQGQDIYSFAKNSFLDFSNEDVFSEMNIANCFMTGEGQYPYQLFNSVTQFEFYNNVEKSVKNNKFFLDSLLKSITESGYHVLIRNVSYLDFPTFHIIIPGLSETGIASKEDYEMIRLMNNSVELFRNPELVDEKKANMLLNLLNHFSYQHYLSFFMHTQYTKNIPFEYAGESVHYYQAILSLALGKYRDSIYYLTLISQSISNGYITESDKNWLLSLVYYISGFIELNNHSDVMGYMKNFFDEEICRRLDECLSESNSGEFNSILFNKMVYRYKRNSIDDYVSKLMDNNRNAMIGNMPTQCRIG